MVYAFLMAWPANGRAFLKSLASNDVVISGVVTLMCSGEEVVWTQTTGALEVQFILSLALTLSQFFPFIFNSF
jgi:hypothetical protein